MMRLIRAFALVVAVSGLFFLWSTEARALSVSLASTTPAGPNTTFSYSATIGLAESFSPSAPADFFTIYDVQGAVSATAPAGFSVSFQNVGVTPVGETPIDNPTVPNVT